MKFSPSALSLVISLLSYPLVAAQKPSTFDTMGTNDEFFSQIVGGEPADAGEFKFMVSWHYNLNSRPSCGM